MNLENRFIKTIDLTRGFMFESDGEYLRLTHHYICIKDNPSRYIENGYFKINLASGFRYIFHKPILEINFDENKIKFKGRKKIFNFDRVNLSNSMILLEETKTKIIGKYSI